MREFCPANGREQLLTSGSDLVAQFRVDTMAGIGHHDALYTPVGLRSLAHHETCINQTIDHTHHGGVRDQEHVCKRRLRHR